MRGATALTLAMISACRGGERAPVGSWLLQGHGIQGGLVSDDDSALIHLQGERWGTGPDGAQATWARHEDGELWLYFPVQTAAGQASATMRVDLEGSTALLPLGYRGGEHDYALKLLPGEPQPAEAPPALIALQQAWQQGGFTLSDGDELAGSLELMPGEQARIQLFTPTALTDGPVPAVRRMEGPDMLLSFPVEPQFDEEWGMLRLNLPTMKAVLPVDTAPHASDAWLLVSPGAPSTEAVSARIEQVQAQALEAERGLLSRLALDLAGAATTLRQEQGRCPQPSQLQPDWNVILSDYRVEVRETPGECLIHLEPRLVQHTCRSAITASAQGVLELEVLGVE
jgi:hypothetical protein